MKKKLFFHSGLIITSTILIFTFLISLSIKVGKEHRQDFITEEEPTEYIEKESSLKEQLEQVDNTQRQEEQEYYEKYLHAKTLVSGDDIVLISKLIYGECNHDNSNEEKSAIGWCALNRLDTGWWGDTLEDVICDGAFAGYDENNNVEEYYNLAKIILTYYNMEKMYGIDTNRTLPKDYLFFMGGGLHNYYTKEYHNGDLEFAINNSYKFD